MPPRFDIAIAFAESFALMRQKPFWLLTWGGLATVLPTLLLIPLFVWMAANASVLSDNPEALAQSAGLSMLSNLSSLISAAISIFAVGAVVRFILGIQRSTIFAGLRIGMDELWVLVAALIYFFGLCIALMLVVAVATAVGAIVGLATGVTGAGVALGILFGLCGIVPLIWVSIRLSLLIPASVELNTIAFQQAWNASKGQFWRLFGTYLLSCLFSVLLGAAMVIVMLIIAAICLGIGAALGLNMDDGAAVLAWVPLILIGGLLALIPLFAYSGISTTMSVAPFASAWRQLNPTVVEHF